MQKLGEMFGCLSGQSKKHLSKLYFFSATSKGKTASKEAFWMAKYNMTSKLCARFDINGGHLEESDGIRF